MTTEETAKRYIVAYPHPKLPPKHHCCVCKIGSETSQEDLLDKLKVEYPDYAKDLGGASFYKADNIDKAEVYNDSKQKVHGWIRDVNPDDEIPWGDPVVESFPGGPRPASLEQVDIMVISKEIREAAGGYVGELLYIKGREERSKDIRGAPSPSDSIKSFAAVKKALTDPRGHSPRYGRPYDQFGPPTALFSEPLALFEHDLKHLESLIPDAEILDNAFEIVAGAADTYENEGDREESLRPFLENLIPGKCKWKEPIASDSLSPGGLWLEGRFPCLIFELKNERGLEGDPFLQALIGYGKIVAQEEYNRYRAWSNMPTILLAIAGNRLVVSAAIFTNAVYADELLSITLRLGPHGSDNVFQVARVFMAIDKCMERLRRLYRWLEGVPQQPPSRTAALWPSPTAVPSESTKRFPKLEYTAKVDHANGTALAVIDKENERHAMYLAQMKSETSDQGKTSTKAETPIETSTQPEVSTRTVFVKFAVQYNEDAHRLLADQNPPLAPALYFCAPVIGDMYMVVMEYISEARSHSVHTLSNGSPPPGELPELVKREVSKALHLLHDHDLVFGDLREPNLLYLPEGGGRVLLVDFDGVGRDNVDRYSACLDPGAGLSPRIKRGQVMKKEHDFDSLELVVERLNDRLPKE